MLSLAFSAGMHGIDGYVVRVEADSSAGSPFFQIIGLPDRALSDARDRVRSAIFNSGFSYPAGRLLVNLSPADVRKEGCALDLAIALALLAIDEQIPREVMRQFIALGELALDGTLRPVSGMLPMALGARSAGFRKLLIPPGNAEEAALVDGVELYAVDSLQAAVAAILGNGGQWRHRRRVRSEPAIDEHAHGDLADVRGQVGRRGSTRRKRTRPAIFNSCVRAFLERVRCLLFLRTRSRIVEKSLRLRCRRFGFQLSVRETPVAQGFQRHAPSFTRAM